MARRGRGMAMVTALWWIAGTSTLLLMGFQWARHQAKLERRIFHASSHLYLAEGVLAREVSRLKARSWHQRWYVHASKRGLQGAALAGSFTDADYTGYVQDVGDFWNDRPTEALEEHVDLFLKVTHPRTGPSSTLHFFARIVLRTPSPERPTPFTMRRLVRVTDFDPADAAARATVLSQMERGERWREWNRAESNVYARVLNVIALADIPLAEVAATLTRPVAKPAHAGALLATAAHAGTASLELQRELERPVFTVHESEARFRDSQALSLREIATHLASPHIEGEIALERQLMQFLRRGQRALLSPDGVPAGRGRYEVAVDELRGAASVADRQDAHNALWTQPLTQFALALSEWALARTYPLKHGNRTELLDRASARLLRIIGSYKYERARMPTRLEAPHAYVPLAFMTMSGADPANPVQFNAYRADATQRLNEWRNRYPGFGPWNEDAQTGQAAAGAVTPADEVAYWETQRLPPPMLLILFSANAGAGEFPNNSVMRWDSTISRWVHQARMADRIPRPDMGGVQGRWTAIQVPATPGAVMGGQILFTQAAKGAGPQLYDTVTNNWRSLRWDPVYDDSFDGPFVSLPDGRVLSVGQQRAEILDLRTETVQEVAPPTRRRTAHKLVALPGGRVLSVGGGKWVSMLLRSEEDAGEVFDASTNAWTPVRNRMSEKRDACTATMLDDGRVLMTGGHSSRVGPSSQWRFSSTAELYLPDQNVFWPGDTMPADVVLPPDLAGRPPIRMQIGRYNHWAVKIQDGPDKGNVLIGGGTNSRSGMQSTSEMFLVASKQIMGWGTTACAGNGIAAARLRDGNVLVMGGANENANYGERRLSGASDLYDWRTRRWRSRTSPLPWLPVGLAYGLSLQVMPD